MLQWSIAEKLNFFDSKQGASKNLHRPGKITGDVILGDLTEKGKSQGSYYQNGNNVSIVIHSAWIAHTVNTCFLQNGNSEQVWFVELALVQMLRKYAGQWMHDSNRKVSRWTWMFRVHSGLAFLKSLRLLLMQFLPRQDFR